MNSMTRTIAFLIAALLSTAAAVGTYMATRPPRIAEYLGVGEPFFARFTDADQANSILVAAWNTQSIKVERFEVIRDPDGLWRIPSHFNYPADGQKQFAQAATSAIGITRISLVSSSSDAHKTYGVIDPLDENPDVVQGERETGTRITFRDAGNTLADYIIGHPREEGGEVARSINEGGRRVMQGVYYVRAAGERQVYLARVNVQVSTRFADWIRSDLLEVDRNDIQNMTLDHYEINPQAKQKVPGELMTLIRNDEARRWAMVGLDSALEQPRRFVVDTLARTLEQLDIVGVRPRRVQYVNKLFVPNDQTVKEDLGYGFFHNTMTGDIAGTAGELRAITAAGIRYTIRYGDIASDSSLNVAGINSATDAAATTTETDASKLGLGRYLLVSVAYDPESLGPAPVEPKKPEGSDPPKPEPTDATESTTADSTTDPAATSTATADNPGIDEYEEALSLYKTRRAEYDKRVKQAQTRVRELEFKFAQWYYIIPEETFSKLHVNRDELVEKIVAIPTDTPATDPLLDPLLNPPATPKPSTEPSTPDPASEPTSPIPSTTETPSPGDSATTTEPVPATTLPTPDQPDSTTNAEPTTTSTE